MVRPISCFHLKSTEKLNRDLVTVKHKATRTSPWAYATDLRVSHDQSFVRASIPVLPFTPTPASCMPSKLPKPGATAEVGMALPPTIAPGPTPDTGLTTLPSGDIHIRSDPGGGRRWLDPMSTPARSGDCT